MLVTPSLKQGQPLSPACNWGVVLLLPRMGLQGYFAKAKVWLCHIDCLCKNASKVHQWNSVEICCIRSAALFWVVSCSVHLQHSMS